MDSTKPPEIIAVPPTSVEPNLHRQLSGRVGDTVHRQGHLKTRRTVIRLERFHIREISVRERHFICHLTRGRLECECHTRI